MPTRGSSPWQPLFISATALLVLLTADLGPPLFHLVEEGVRLRPLYGAHTVLACYIFLPVASGVVAVGFGFTTLVAHVTVLAAVSYPPHHQHYSARVS